MSYDDSWLEGERFKNIRKPYVAPAVVEMKTMCSRCEGAGDTLVTLWPEVIFAECSECDGTGVHP